MSKIVKVSRNFGEFLTRFDSRKYQKVGSATPHNMNIVAPDKRADYMARVGINPVTDNYTPEEVFTSFSIAKLDAANAPKDANYDDCVINQNAVTITKISDNEYEVSADISSLKAYASSNPSQGTHKWVGIKILTGESTIVGLEWNGTALTEADVTEASTVGIPAGGIIYWFKADGGSVTLSIAKEDKTTAITFIPVDTAE